MDDQAPIRRVVDRGRRHRGLDRSGGARQAARPADRDHSGREPTRSARSAWARAPSPLPAHSTSCSGSMSARSCARQVPPSSSASRSRIGRAQAIAISTASARSANRPGWAISTISGSRRARKAGAARWATIASELQAAQAGRFTIPEQGHINYAYHLDAGLYARFLRQFAEPLGVNRIEGRIERVEQHPETGFVSCPSPHLRTTDRRRPVPRLHRLSRPADRADAARRL